MQVETVELLADLEEEDSEDERRNQEIECNAQLNHHGHSVGRAGCSEEEAIFHREKSNHLGNGLAARDHHEEGEQDDSKRDADRVASDGCGEQADWLRQTKSEDYKHQPDEHGDRNVDQRSLSHWTPSRLISVWRIQGSVMTFRIRVSAAE